MMVKMELFGSRKR